jgi:hypothetical protein
MATWRIGAPASTCLMHLRVDSFEDIAGGLVYSSRKEQSEPLLESGTLY